MLLCDPFYQNETLLCKTPNVDMAENTFFNFEIFAKSLKFMCNKSTVKVLDHYEV